MRVEVCWESTYRYSEPVRQMHCELRVVPRSDSRQRLVDAAVEVQPATNIATLEDAFGNRYEHLDSLGARDTIALSVRAAVEVEPQRLARDPLTPLHRALYLRPTERCPFDPRLGELASAFDGGDAVAFAAALSERLAGSFRYEVGATEVHHGAMDLLKRGSGVCQDFAHLMLAVLRRSGIPARYVSGYLAPHEGAASAEASHAWVQVYSRNGWHGFDPAHGIEEDNRYVVVAVGRDYDDVPPLRGTFVGCASETWTTNVELGAVQSQQ